jgi:Hydrazine synthase alpha subunit middle domain
MSYDTRNVVMEQIRRGALLVTATLAAVILAACSSSDGSVGVGTGQQPDPVAPDFPVAYTKGPLFDDNMQLQSNTDVRDILRFNVGTDLYVRDRASPTAPERNVTMRETQGLGDVMGVEISDDGKKVLFAMRGPFDPNLNDDEQPTWNIWEYTLATDTLRRIIASDITAEAGQDVSPHYLPDGRIVFVSTRQRQAKAILLDEGKPQFDARDEDRQNPAFVLHVMRDDGSDLHQISFNQSSDYDPTVLASGKILFGRWDHAGGVNGINLYQMNPDGTELELVYGAHSHMTGTNNTEVEFLDGREMPDGRIMAIVRQFDHPELGGAISIIDTKTYVENTQPVAASAGMTGPAQTSATPNQVRTDIAPSQGGRFSSAFPLWDGTGRVLASWEICRLAEPDPNDATATIFVPCTDARLAGANPVVAPPLYGIWMYDPQTQTQLPIVTGQEGVLIGDVVAAQPRVNPQSIPDKVAGVDFDVDLVAEGAGILNIRSVYDIDGVASVNIGATADPVQTPPANRPARFLRVEKAVAIPDPNDVDLKATAFGPNIQQGMREIVAYAPVEPDGSVRVKVPADVALAVSVLDANGRRIGGRHQNWLQLIPGQELTCNGCHTAQSGMSHGRNDAFTAAYAGAPSTGVPFPNTVSTLSPDAGETMAETRTRVSCQTDCAALEPSVDVVYDDVWTDSAVATPAASFAYRYTALTTPTPVNVNCISNWTASCRIVINYETHIHPLWSAPRQVIDPMTMTVLEDHTCSQGGCHAPVDAMGAAMVPAAQLDLSDGLSADEPDQFNAYRELLFADNEQVLNNGALQDRQVQIGVDAMGNPILAPVSISGPMSAGGARASARFFNCFDAGATGCPTEPHVGFLSPDELKLIAEWLDIGAQYYNDPFQVPVM